MVVQNKRLEKTCCFYVSDYHLEMILIPYIIKNINERFTILTERNLKDTVEFLTSKMNINDEEKEKILKLSWDCKEDILENSNIIIIGNKKYINERNKEIEKLNCINIIDCYDFNEEKDNMEEIIKNYKCTLNTLGKKFF